MTPELLIIILVTSPLLALLIYLLKVNNKVKLDGNRYMFFKVRDDLVMLVAQGYLKENEFLFQEYYNMTNLIINNTHRFTFKRIVKSLARISQNMEKDATIERIKKELREKDPEVKNVILEFYQTMLKVLYRNSFIIRLIVWCIFPFAATVISLKFLASIINKHFDNRYVKGTRVAWKSRNNINYIMALNPST